jgi:oligopeptidase B
MPTSGTSCCRRQTSGSRGDLRRARTSQELDDNHGRVPEHATQMTNAFAEGVIAPRAPAAKREPFSRKFHDTELVDEYAWLRAPNWKEALHDPGLLPADVLEHLRAENAYSDWFLRSSRALRESVLTELRAYSDPRWLRPPLPFGPYLYDMRYADAEQPLLVRQRREGGPELILLDCNQLAEGRPFFKLSTWRVSPSHRFLAYAVDLAGSEQHQIRIRDLETGSDLPDQIVDASARMVWARGGRSLVYVGLGPDLRPNRVLQHQLSASSDGELYAEHDPAWSVSVRETTSRSFGLITIRNSDDTEVRVFDLGAEQPKPRLVQGRMPGLAYHVDDFGERLIIRTNADGAVDYKLVSAPIDKPGREHWRDLVSHRPGVSILSHRCLDRHLVRTEREDASVRIIVRGHADGAEHDVSIAEPIFSLHLEPSCEFKTSVIRFTTSTPLRPNATTEYDMDRRSSTVVKRQATPPGFDLSRFSLRRLWVRAPDDELIPVSVVCRRDLPLDGTSPCLLHGYGAYGSSVDPEFAVERLPLLQRGFVFAIAHVRGGSERGQRWYREGKLDKRTNAFTDFLSVANELIRAGYTRRGLLVAHGRSAGGMLVGAAVNLDPSLFAGVIADVPFVDVLNTMLDDELPLTPPEWLEWGNPIRDPDAFERIRSYAPYEQIRPAEYPPVLAIAGLSDPRVTYWEPAKWILRLRDKAAGGPFLLTTELHAGHAGNEGRFRRFRDRAREIAFALRCVGLA